ncbi:hypothetical protein ACODT3_10510 [Streptomyces sp. 4.24]|uniref:hypothetical protein n=1 Tax=Streptomyces tritrimontium TaxID=3406573 RepID=UPI003BB70702
MADLLPVDTTSSAIASLTPSIARLDVPAAAVEAEARRMWAERNLRVAALNAGVSADEYRRAGELLEQRHQFLDLDADSAYTIPGAVYGSYLQLGGQS